MPEYGEVVVATAGRDKDRWFAVVRTDGNWVWIADGKRRPLSRPKRKNPRHLRATGCRCISSEMTTNRELRCVLRKWQNSIT